MKASSLVQWIWVIYFAYIAMEVDFRITTGQKTHNGTILDSMETRKPGREKLTLGPDAKQVCKNVPVFLAP